MLQTDFRCKISKEKNQGFFSSYRSLFSKSKKGELTTQQIVTILIVIASFIILLYFLFRINPGETNQKQICYNSVLLSSKGEGLVGSLDCQTNYLCVSGGSACEQFNPTVTAKVDTAKKEEILKTIADEMADCWWMFGEGKVDYMGSSFLGGELCAACSTVKFDKELQSQMPKITYSELYDYMRTSQKSSSQSYLNYIYSANTLDPFGNFTVPNYLNREIDTSKNYLILTGISKKPVWRWFTISDVNHIPVTLIEQTPENYEAIGCDEFITKAG